MYSRNGHQDTPQSRLIAVETPTQLFITNIIRESSKVGVQKVKLMLGERISRKTYCQSKHSETRAKSCVDLDGKGDTIRA